MLYDLRKMNQRIPIPPRSVLRIKKLWPHARSKGHENGEIRRVGYYSRQDGLDCVWLVDAKGHYDWTTDHEWLYEMFEVIEYSDETDLHRDDRPVLGAIESKADQGGVINSESLRSST